MRVLVFTNMYPTPAMPFYGTFVRDEAEALRRAGLDVDVYFVNGRANKLNYVAMPFGFFSRLRRARYDVIHVHHSFCGLVATVQRRIPVVWTFHEGEISRGEDSMRDPRRIKRLAHSKGLKRRVARKVDGLVVVSEHLRALLGRPDAVVLPSGLDLARFQPMETIEAKRRLGLAADRRYVLFPASPSRVEKRYDLARRAVERLRELAPEARDVELIPLDHVPHEEVPAYMNAAEVVLLTSAFEASPVTIREALACNVPVVATEVGDARVVLEGIDGCRLVDPDPDRIAESLRAVLAGPRRVRGRERMHDHSVEAVAASLVALYGRVRENHRKRAS